MQIRIEKPIVVPGLKIQNVAAYARVSVENELTDHSLSNQIEYYSNYIKTHPGWRFAGVYADEGLTGTKMNRPGFQNLLRDCDGGKIDIILTKSLSRFSRNTLDLLNTTRHLKDLGINVWFERENIWSMSHDGELMLTLLASFAQEESRSVSENTRWAIRKRFEQGLESNPLLYGYRWDGKEHHIVPEEAQIVREVFSSYLEGMTPDGIAAMMRKRGIKPPEGGDFSYSLVRAMLRTEKYTGDSILQKTFGEDHLTKKRRINRGQRPMYYATETHPPIISKQMFDDVQAEIRRRAELGYRANQSITFSCFTAKVICGKCGRTYRRRSSGSKRYKNIYHRWVCGNRIEHTRAGCPSQTISENTLYSSTMEVLGVDDLNKQVFDSIIDHITVSGHCTLTFHMKDGRLIEKHWLLKTNNTTIREAVNGKDSYGNTGDEKQVFIS